MNTPSCQIPPIALGLLNEAGELVVFDDTRGLQLLALMAAKAANDARVKVAA